MRPGIKRRVRDGVVEFRCTNPACLLWKPEEEFGLRKENPWGRQGQCRACFLAGRREYERGAERVRRRSEIEKEKRRIQVETAKQADRERRRQRSSPTPSTPAFVEREKIAPFLEKLLAQSEGDLGKAAWNSGTTNRTLYAIRSGERPTARWEIAEKIAIAVNGVAEFMAQFPEPGVEGWNKAGDRFCRRCGRWDLRHRARGFCFRCYSVVYLYERKGLEVPALRDEIWSRYEDCCMVCQTVDRPHHALGLCEPCYGGVRRRSVLNWKEYARRMEQHRQAKVVRRLARVARASINGSAAAAPIRENLVKDSPKKSLHLPSPTERTPGRV